MVFADLEFAAVAVLFAFPGAVIVGVAKFIGFAGAVLVILALL